MASEEYTASEVKEACRNGDLIFFRHRIMEMNGQFQGTSILEQTDKDGNSPLHHATRFGKLELVQILVDAGADVNAPNMLQQTPMHVAASNDRCEIVKVLLSKGGNVYTENAFGKSPKEIAVSRENTSLSKLMEYETKPGINIKSAVRRG